MKGFVAEVAANFEFLFGKLSLDQLRAKIAAIEAETEAALLLLENPEARKYLDGPPKAAGRGAPSGLVEDPKDAMKLLETQRQAADQFVQIRREMQEAVLAAEQAGVQKLIQLRELEGEEAIEAQADLVRRKAAIEEESLVKLLQVQSIYYQELTQLSGLSADQRTEAEAKHAAAVTKIVGDLFKLRQSLRAEDEKIGAAREDLRRKEQEGLGRGERFNAGADRAAYLRSLDDELELARANQAEVEALYTSTSIEIAEARLRVFEAMRRKELEQENLTAAAKERINAEYFAKIRRQAAQADALGGIVQGLSDYVRDLDSAFGLMRDLARQTAQAMNGFFQKFFLDALEGRLRSFRDVVRGVVEFTKTLLVQVAAQVATIMTLRLLLTGFGDVGIFTPGVVGTFHEGGAVPRRFALGGPVLSNGDRVPALLSRGEYVLRASAVEKLDRLNAGDASALRGDESPRQVTVHVHGVPEGTQVRALTRRERATEVIDIILENLEANGALRAELGLT